MTTTTRYANSPIKMCRTCGYRKGDDCLRSGLMWEVERQFAHISPHCNLSFSGWVSKPPRRSLRRWLYDTLFA